MKTENKHIPTEDQILVFPIVPVIELNGRTI